MLWPRVIVDEALGRTDLEQFDVIISDLTEDANSGPTISEIQRKRLLTPIASNGERQSEIIKAFKMGAVNFFSAEDNNEELDRSSNKPSRINSSL